METSKKIALICASPPGINPGMSSVDLGFLSLVSQHNIPGQVTMYQLYSPPKILDKPGDVQIQYSTLPDDPDFFESQDLIIFWGDFLQMYQYHEVVAKILVSKNRFANIEEAKKRVKEVFLLKGKSTEVIQKAYSFGGTILFNTITNETEVDYREALSNFLAHAGGLWFRDVFSALKACHLRNIYQPACLGVDCATLIDPELIKKSNDQNTSEKQIGLFIGRTAIHVREIADFAIEITRRISGKINWLEWGDVRAFPSLRKVREVLTDFPVDGYNEEGIRNPEHALKSLTAYKLIITDTYHVCVNAWNLGIPAICFYGSDVIIKQDVSSGNIFSKRDKRQVFMSMYDGLDFLISFAELKNQDLIEKRIEMLIDKIGSTIAIRAINQRIRQHAIQSGQAFIDSINKHLW